MHLIMPPHMTQVPCLVDLHCRPLIGIADAGTFVTQLRNRERTVIPLKVLFNDQLLPNSETLHLPKL
jgi:hypothetical protein